MRSFLGHLRYALRTLLRRPAFTAGAVLSLALGIGANAAIFACVDAVLLQPLPVSRPGELTMVYATLTGSPGGLFGHSYLNYRDYRDDNPVFSALLAFRTIPVRLSGSGGGPEVITGEAVSSNYFAALGVRPQLGRTFVPQEDQTPGGPRVVVLSDGLWRRRLAADPQAIGRAILLNGRPFTVVGVAPRELHGLSVLLSPELWVPVGAYDALMPDPPGALNDRNLLLFSVVGRLKPGISMRLAESTLRTMAGRLAREHPVENEGQSIAIVPLAQATIHHSLRQGFVLGSEVLMALVGALLLVACANVANLLLARALERRKEIAVRLSVGASRANILGQLVAEGLVLAFAGGAVGLMLAGWGRDLLWSLRPPLLPATLDVGLDARVLGFAFLLCVVTGVVFGLVPLAQTRRLDLLSALKDAGGIESRVSRRLGLRQLLVVAQVALSLVALVGAGVFLASLRNALHLSPGYQTEHLALVSFDLGAQGYDEARSRELQRRLLERAAGLPGVRSAALAERVMLDLRGTSRLRVDPGDAPEGKGPLVRVNSVSPGYFESLEIPLQAGRGFTDSNRQDAPRVAVINETMASRFWPGRGAVGQRFALESEDVQVVGVARDCKYESLGQDAEPYIYVPLAQRPATAVTLHVRTTGEPKAVLAPLRREIQALDPELPLTADGTMEGMMDKSLWASRAAAGLLSAFSLLALVLAAAGVYSTMAFAVRNRIRELGIRMALGAQRGDLLRLILREGMLLVAIGVLVGALVAGLALPRISALVFGLRDAAPLAFAAAALVVLAVSFAANLFPSRRAMATNAAWVLRGGE